MLHGGKGQTVSHLNTMGSDLKGHLGVIFPLHAEDYSGMNCTIVTEGKFL